MYCKAIIVQKKSWLINTFPIISDFDSLHRLGHTGNHFLEDFRTIWDEFEHFYGKLRTIMYYYKVQKSSESLLKWSDMTWFTTKISCHPWDSLREGKKTLLSLLWISKLAFSHSHEDEAMSLLILFCNFIFVADLEFQPKIVSFVAISSVLCCCFMSMSLVGI